MNNSGINNTKIITPLTKLDWFRQLRSIQQQWIDLSLIPIGVIGILLNILALIVLRSNKFTIPFYTYLRAYTIASIFICFVDATQFTAGARSLLEFTNSKLSIGYYCFFFYPFQVLINTFGNMLDIGLSVERVALLSDKLKWFKKINPKVLCLIFLALATLLTLPYFLLLSTSLMKVQIQKDNSTVPFIIHLAKESRIAKLYIKRDFFRVFPFIIEIVPIIIETSFNILSIILIKTYSKNRTKLIIPISSNNRGLVSIVNNRSSKGMLQIRVRRMEVKLTILVIFMSFASAM
jgi:hypothetical protein